MHSWIGFHKWMLLMSLSLLLQHVLFVLLWWFVRWEVSGCTVVVLKSVASKNCSKQHVAFLCSSHLAFSLCILISHNKIASQVWKTRKSDNILLWLCNTVYRENTIEKWMKGCNLPSSRKVTSESLRNITA